MFRKMVLGGFVLIGGYLVLVHFTGFVKDAGAASNGTVGVIKGLQGR